MFATRLAASLDQIVQIQAHLPGAAALTIAIIGVSVAWVPGLWHVLRPVHAMAHEGAHATVGSAFGHKVEKMEFKFNGDGSTHFGWENAGTLTKFPAAFAGYIGSSAFGIGAAEMIRFGHIVAVLWAGLAGMIPILYLARKSVGVILVAGTVVALILLLGTSSVGVQVLAAYAVAWFLLGSGVRVVISHWKGAGDAFILKDMTGLPRGFWPPFWLIGAGAALLYGSTLLL